MESGLCEGRRGGGGGEGSRAARGYLQGSGGGREGGHEKERKRDKAPSFSPSRVERTFRTKKRITHTESPHLIYLPCPASFA